MNKIKRGATGLMVLKFPENGITGSVQMTFDGDPVPLGGDFGFGFAVCGNCAFDEVTRCLSGQVVIEAIFTTDSGRIRYEKKKERLKEDCKMYWNNALSAIDYRVCP